MRKKNITVDEVQDVYDMWTSYRSVDYIVKKTRLSRRSVCRIIQFLYLFDEAGYLK